MVEKDLTSPQGEPTLHSIARRLPNSPRSASSYFSICTKIVQFVFPPDRTVNHKFPAAPIHFRDPLLKSAEKILLPLRTFDGVRHKNVARRLMKKVAVPEIIISWFFPLFFYSARRKSRIACLSAGGSPSNFRTTVFASEGP